MTIKKTRYQSLELSPENIEGLGGTDFTRDGEIGADSSDNELKVRLNSTTKTVVTEDQIQVLTNKGIDADTNTILNLETDNLKSGVLNTSTTLASASDTQIPSALAVKTYVDDKAAAQNEASEISYDNFISTIISTNVQGAIDELDLRLLDAETGVTNNAADITNHINDTVDAHAASAITNTPSGNLAATDVQGALNELQSSIDGIVPGYTDHTLLSNIGTNTHAQIDSHIANTSNPHSVTKAQVGLGSVVNADTTTTANITDSANKRFVTDAEKTVIGNTSGTNTGDQTFNSLSPMTTLGDMIRGGTSGAGTRLPIGTDGQFLTVSSGIPSWTGVSPGAPRIAVLWDQKTAGTLGGAATSNTYNVRELNNIIDPTSIVTSLSSNLFTLPAGTYKFTASAPAYNAGYHKIALNNNTDSTYPITGSTEYANTTTTRSFLSGIITITSSKSFYLGHNATGFTATSIDLGIAAGAGLGLPETYAILEIQKL